MGFYINIWIIFGISLLFLSFVKFGLYKLGFCQTSCQYIRLASHLKVVSMFYKNILLIFTTSLSTVPLISWKVNWATGLYWELNFETVAIWGSITASSSLGLRVGFVRSHDPPPSLFPAVMHLWWEATTSWVLGQGLWVPRELRHGVIQTASSWQAGWPQLSVQKEHSTQTGNKWKLKREENKVPSNWCQTPRKLS